MELFMNQTKVQAIIPFAGFYESWHSEAIDNAINRVFEDISGEPNTTLVDKAFNCTNYKQIFEAYAKEFTKAFKHELNAKLEYNKPIRCKFIELVSPREYNFSTNKIIAEFDLEFMQWLLDAKVYRDRFERLCRDELTSRSGFISFYNPDFETWGELAAWDYNQLGLLLQALVNQGFSEDWEHSIIEDLDGNGNIEGCLHCCYDDADFKRLADIADYLRTRQQRVEGI